VGPCATSSAKRADQGGSRRAALRQPHRGCGRGRSWRLRRRRLVDARGERHRDDRRGGL